MVPPQRFAQSETKSMSDVERIVLNDVSVDVRAGRRTKRLLDQVSFAVDKSERVAYVGPNGAGKSTTIRSLVGIQRPSSGTIHVDGVDVTRKPRQVARLIGAVFGQKTQMWWDLPVRDSFEMIARLYGLGSTKESPAFRSLVDALELNPLLTRAARSLSLGERMKCELACALIHSPSYLILDEPTNGLDASSKRTYREFLRNSDELHGTTILLTSHDIDDVVEICERIVLLDHGRVRLDMSMIDFRRTYCSERIVELRDCTSVTTTNIAGVKLVSHTESEARFAVDTNLTPVPLAVEELIRATSARDLTVSEPSVEEVLIQLYEGHR